MHFMLKGIIIHFYALAELAKEQANNSAYQILKVLQEEIEGRFEDEKLQIFEGLCRLALESKVLTYRSFQEYADWLKFMRKQMENDIIIKDQFERTFSGFAYEKLPGKVAYYLDADWATVKARHEKCKMSGQFVTPIYSKTYWFHDINKISELRKNFAREVELVIDDTVIQLTKSIMTLPSAVSQEKYKKLRQHVRENCSSEAYQSFVGYGYRWHIE